MSRDRARPPRPFGGGAGGAVNGVHRPVDGAANSASRQGESSHPQLWKTSAGHGAMGPLDELKTFCEDAARQMVGIETRLRTLVAARGRQPEMTLIEEAVAPSLRLARALLDAGRRGRHERLLALRPLVRALRLTDW